MTASDSVVHVEKLSRTFGPRRVLDNVTLSVPRGCVLGLVGVNGAGKTTLLRHVLGLLRAESGSVRVFGLDPAADPVGVLSRLGHVSDDCDLPGHLRVGELLAYTAAFYPRWDQAHAADMLARFGLDPAWRVNALSRGLRARAALVVALAHRPDLLVLDEPSAGLDPLARRDILGAVIRAAADDGATVIFSSHLLDEVERVADRIALLDGGRLAFCGEIDAVRDRHRRIVLRFADPRQSPPELAGVLRWEGGGREWSAVCEGELDAVLAGVDSIGGRVVESGAARLDEVVVAHAGREGR